MYFVYFSWLRNQNFRVPSSTKVKVATAGRAFGVWNEKDSTFKFKLPAGICTADVSFMGTTGIHEFHFTTDSAEAFHVASEHIDYNDTSDAFLLMLFCSCCGKHPQVVELPLPRVSGFTKFHNPTRPSHLVGGALVRGRRAYSPSEIRSTRAVGLEQSPAYFSRRVRSMSRTPDREDRARSYSQPRSTSSPGSLDLESIQGTGQCPHFRIKPKEPCLQKGGTRGLYLVEADPDPGSKIRSFKPYVMFMWLMFKLSHLSSVIVIDHVDSLHLS